jgi:diacylglycerol kinase (ATP)
VQSGALIFNPASGRGDKARQALHLVEVLRSLGAGAELFPTRGSGDAAVRAREAVENGAEFLAVFGGDGSVREAGEVLAGSAIPLLILPAGTSNVLARSLKIPLDPLNAVRLLAEGRPAALDGGRANGHAFFFMCGTGLDAEVMGALHLPLKKLLGRASFYPAVLRLLAGYVFPALRIEADGEPLEGGYAVVTNIPHYAGKYVLVPGADPFDGMLDLVVFKAASRLDFLKLYPRLVRATLMDHPDVVHRRVRSVRIQGPPATRFQLDGDTLGNVPVEVAVLPAALKVFVPYPSGPR